MALFVFLLFLFFSFFRGHLPGCDWDVGKAISPFSFSFVSSDLTPISFLTRIVRLLVFSCRRPRR